LATACIDGVLDVITISNSPVVTWRAMALPVARIAVCVVGGDGERLAVPVALLSEALDDALDTGVEHRRGRMLHDGHRAPRGASRPAPARRDRRGAESPTPPQSGRSPSDSRFSAIQVDAIAGSSRARSGYGTQAPVPESWNCPTAGMNSHE
jgi:hypothetical protein